MTAPLTSQHFPSTQAMIEALEPSYPVYCIRPQQLAANARNFLQTFPGRVLYAVKCNPHPLVLTHLHAAGISDFDTASLNEIALVHELFEHVNSYYMHPVKPRAHISSAYHVYGVRRFIVDHDDELKKLLGKIDPRECQIFVRMATPSGGAVFDLSSKFGAKPDQTVTLLRDIQACGARSGLAFHVGSQCLRPAAFRVALDLVATVLESVQKPIDALDVGGGFPAPYLGNEIPQLENFIGSIKLGLTKIGLPQDCELLCEPGRAMVANAVSLVTQIQLRKDDQLYLNDGIYGSLSEACIAGFRYPVRLLRNPGPCAMQQDFTIFGPTCDSADVLPYSFSLPNDAREGDWIEIGQIGAYSNSNRTQFNGFHAETFVTIDQAMQA